MATNENLPEAQQLLELPEGEPLRLLIAVHPGSDTTEAAEFAAWISRTTEVRVRAAGTVRRPWPVTGLSKISGRYESWVKNQAKDYAKEVTEIFDSAGLEKRYWDKEYAVFADGPSEPAQLLAETERFGAHAVVLGSTGAADKGRFQSGSTANELLHSSPFKLCLVPREPKLSKKGVTRVNIALLNSEYEHNDAALRLGCQLALRWDVPLRLVAFTPSGLADPNDTLPSDLSKDLSEQSYEYVLSMLDRFRAKAAQDYEDLEINTAVGAGAGWAGANDSVKWKRGDLLCLASSPIDSFTRVFIGSTEAEFLRHTRVPVLVSPAPGH